MTNEEKILARLEELTEEVREAKKAIRPYVELKQEMEPLVNDMIVSAIHKLSGLDRRFELEDVADMIGQLLISSKHLTEALQSLNRFMEFKKEFEPYSKEMFKELTAQMETALHGFNPQDLQELVRQFIGNMGNIAEGLKMIGSVMEMRQDASALSKQAFNDVVMRLENLKQRGIFDAAEYLLLLTEQFGTGLKNIDLQEAKPITGIFGMMSAMRRPEVQEGLGVLVELSTAMSALKSNQQPC